LGGSSQTLALACSLLVVGAHSAAILTYGVHPVVHTAPVVHQTVVRRPSVTQHSELVYVPHHEHGYTIEQSKVVQPKTSVVHHHPLTGLPYHQTDVHHPAVVTGSRSSVHQSRPAHFVHRTNTIVV
ncbi:uncharacterized protein LOC144139827, partial [Haemaphysalis longicornis]